MTSCKQEVMHQVNDVLVRFSVYTT